MIINDRQSQRNIRALVLFLTIGVGLFIGIAPSSTQGDQSPVTTAVAYQNGVITGMHNTTLEINRKSFSLTPDVVLLDRHGDELSARFLKVDLEVKYHLEKGSQDRIDRMIVFLPE